MLEDITFTAEAGQLIFLTGRTGAGKTSLLRVVNGEIRVDSGALWVAGFPVHSRWRRTTALRRHVGIVFQDYGLIPWMTASENVEFAYRVSHFWESGRRARDLAAEILDTVGLGARMDALPRELSGGEQQRVALARAIVSNPAVLLADEPTGNLDEATSLEMLRLLRKVADDGALVVVATHDRALLRAGGRRLHLVDGRMLERPRIATRAS